MMSFLMKRDRIALNFFGENDLGIPTEVQVMDEQAVEFVDIIGFETFSILNDLRRYKITLAQQLQILMKGQRW